MNKIIINECINNIYPVYSLYTANENGEIILIAKSIKH